MNETEANELKELETQLRALNAEEERCENQLDAARKAVRKNTIRQLELKFGCRIGAKVTDGKRVGTIQSLNSIWNADNKPWLMVKLFKKDGTQGNRVVSFFRNWDLA